MRSTLLILSLLLTSGITPAIAQKKVGVVCLSKGNQIVAKSKCGGSETKLSLAELGTRANGGDTGASGAIGSSGRVVVSTDYDGQTMDSSGLVLTQDCPPGKTTLSGGCYTLNRLIVMTQSYPYDGSPNSWRCKFVPRVTPATLSGVNITTYAICVDE